jgi:hypothetical protein
MAAKDNEKLIYKQLVSKYKIDFEKSKPEIIVDGLEVSVDFIWKDKDLTYLFEIDSNNAAKIIFGEYVLLNQVKAYKSNCILVIIHFYKNYNIERTRKYLKFANEKLECKLPYLVFSNSEWHELIKTKNKTQLINLFKKSLKPNN